MAEPIDVALVGADDIVVNIIVIDPDDNDFRDLLAGQYAAVVELPSQAEHLDPTSKAVRPSAGWLYKPKSPTKFAEATAVAAPVAPVSQQVGDTLAADPDYVALTAAEKAVVTRLANRLAVSELATSQPSSPTAPSSTPGRPV